MSLMDKKCMAICGSLSRRLYVPGVTTLGYMYKDITAVSSLRELVA